MLALPASGLSEWGGRQYLAAETDSALFGGFMQHRFLPLFIYLLAVCSTPLVSEDTQALNIPQAQVHAFMRAQDVTKSLASRKELTSYREDIAHMMKKFETTIVPAERLAEMALQLRRYAKLAKVLNEKPFNRFYCHFIKIRIDRQMKRNAEHRRLLREQNLLLSKPPQRTMNAAIQVGYEQNLALLRKKIESIEARIKETDETLLDDDRSFIEKNGGWLAGGGVVAAALALLWWNGYLTQWFGSNGGGDRGGQPRRPTPRRPRHKPSELAQEFISRIKGTSEPEELSEIGGDLSKFLSGDDLQSAREALASRRTQLGREHTRKDVRRAAGLGPLDRLHTSRPKEGLQPSDFGYWQGKEGKHTPECTCDNCGRDRRFGFYSPPVQHPTPAPSAPKHDE